MDDEIRGAFFPKKILMELFHCGLTITWYWYMVYKHYFLVRHIGDDRR